MYAAYVGIAREGMYEYTERDFLEIEKAIRERIEDIMSFSTKVWWLFDRQRTSPLVEMMGRRVWGLGKLPEIP